MKDIFKLISEDSINKGENKENFMWLIILKKLIFTNLIFVISIITKFLITAKQYVLILSSYFKFQI